MKELGDSCELKRIFLDTLSHHQEVNREESSGKGNGKNNFE